MNKLVIICASSLSFALCGAAFAVDVQFKAPQQIQNALATLNRVVDHTGRLITAQNYAQLPGENNEFHEGSQALETSLSAEGGDIAAKVKPMIAKANDDAQSIAAAAASRDDKKLAAGHKALAASVKQIMAAFPSNVQPPAPNLAQERHEEDTRGTTGSAR
jgi:hypothetical protein